MAHMSSNLKTLMKLLQRRLYTFVGSWMGFFIVICGCFFVVISILNTMAAPCTTMMRGAHLHCSETDYSDNIGHLHMEKYLAYGPIDAVYSWVNGSDPVWQAKKLHWMSKIFRGENVTLPTNDTAHDDTTSHNRFRDSEELRYSLRSLEKYAPWIRNVYIVTDNQVPYWLNLESTRLHVVPHSAIFPNRSDLPVFSSPAIETHLHRIEGLSKKFIYFNDDVFLGSPTLPEDFYTLGGAQRLYMAWDVPKCAPGCSDSWIGDGYCDKACNVSACNFDYPDCVNGTSGKRSGARGTGNTHAAAKEAYFCANGCPDSWLGDKVCDAKCKSANCGWDAGDCGIDLVHEDFEGVSLLTAGYAKISLLKERTGRAHLDAAAPKEVILLGHNADTVSPDPHGLTSMHTNIHNPGLTAAIHKEHEESYPVALTVPYGTRGVYFNLSYLPCTGLSFSTAESIPISSDTIALQGTQGSSLTSNKPLFPYSALYSPTCSEDEILSPFGHFPGRGSHNSRTILGDVPAWSNFSYLSVNYTVVPVNGLLGNDTDESTGGLGDLIATAHFLRKQHMLIILLRGHDDEYNVQHNMFKNISHAVDVRFQIQGFNAVSHINISAHFTLRIIPKLPKMADIPIPTGMGEVEGMLSQCHEKEFSGQGQSAISTDSASSLSSDDVLFIKSMTHTRQPYRLFAQTSQLSNVSQPRSRLATFEREGIMLTVWLHTLSYKMFHAPISHLSTVGEFTLLNGTRYRTRSSLCDMLADLDRTKRVSQRTLLHGQSICDSKLTLGQLLYAVDASHSLTTAPSAPLRLLLHMPVMWGDLVSRDKFNAEYVHVTLEILVTNMQITSSGDGSSSRDPETADTGTCVMCVHGALRWGLKLPNITHHATNKSDLHLFSNSSLTNSTFLHGVNGTTNHSSGKDLPSKGNDESSSDPVKVDTYASSLRHVNNLYRQVGKRMSI